MNQPLAVTDFSGGMTDEYLAGPLNRGQTFDNLLLNNNKKPFTRPGSVIRDETDDQVPSGIKRISAIWDHRDQVIEQTERHLYYFTSSYQELTGPTGNQGLGIGTESHHISQTFWNNHTLIVSDSFCKPMKVFKNDVGTLRVVNAGMPALATAPTVTAGGAGANNYIYAFLYYYTYNVEGVTFEDFGATTQVSLASALAPDSSTVAITNIPVISNGTTDNYDTTVIKVKIYRTQNNGTTFTFIGEVTNGTTTYNDSASDASIVNNVLIYTTGDVVDNDTPPPAKFVHVADDIALYGYVKEGSVEVPNRLRQSIKGDIDSCPEDFILDFPEHLMGINSIQGTFIVFCKSSVWRVSGFFDEQGRGGMSKLKISDTVGCVSNDSIVQTDHGLFFAAQQGFYFTDGYQVKKISHHIEDTYQTLVSTTTKARRIWGAFDEIENRIWWAANLQPDSTDNDTCFILDLNWGISEESTFTTASNGEYFAPTALLFKGADMYRADKRGYLLVHNVDYLTDPKIDTNEFASVWVEKAIIHLYKSCAFDFGTSFVRKFVPKILSTFANHTNIAIQISSINDDGRVVADLKPIRYTSNIVWGDPEIIWGDPDILWNVTGLIEEQRMFPARNLRCNYKQIIITNAYMPIKNSDLLGLATVDSVANTATLVTATSAWPADPVDYTLAFEDDDYTNEFIVTERNSDTVLTFLDATALSPNTGNYKWLLRGYRKGEKIEILSYVIHFQMLTDSQKSFHSPADTGNNA